LVSLSLAIVPEIATGRTGAHLSIRGLGKRLGDRWLVRNIDLDLKVGELLVVLGASGSGKTLTLRMINRLIQPTTGIVRIDGVDTAELPPHELRRAVGYVVQGIGLFPHMTVEENVSITPRLLGWASRDIDAQVDELLDLVQLNPTDFRTREPESLSGGQKQRVGVARALAANPKLILLDEPFGALDPITRLELQRSFRDIQRALRMTAIFVTHDIAEALILGDRIAVMKGGRLVQVATPHEMLDKPENAYVETLLRMPERQAKLIQDRLESRSPYS
jgi:osmoprotectant transport system ATP-binding protein